MERLGRFLGAFFGAFLCIVLLMGIYSIAEDITLTTYYPAPYGAYDELTTTGNTYLSTTSGNVGIGTTNPGAKFQMNDGNAEFGFGDSLNTGMQLINKAGGTPYIDFSNDSTSDFDMRIRMTGDDSLVIEGGNFGIGREDPNYPLDVVGDINTTGDVRKNGTAYTNPDYVFEPGYSLMNIADVKSYVFENKHLPNMPSTEEIKQDGIKLFEQNRLLLEKLEEAYLHIFKLEERITKLESTAQKKR